MDLRSNAISSCSTTDSPKHAAKDDPIERQDGIPVNDAAQSSWLEPGDMLDPGQARRVFHRPQSNLQDGFPWGLHLSP